MKNILLITTMYPADDIQVKNNTAVCHYFAKEWIRLGYAVRVINLYNVYPAFYYPILRVAKNYFADRFGIAILDKKPHAEHNYVMDGIKVTRLLAYKSRPHGDFSENVISRLAERIFNITQEENLVPDYILGHFILPNIRVVAALKDKYPNAIVTTALHGKENHMVPSIYTTLPKIDYIGYRSFPIKNSFEAIYGIKPFFMCMSGVPSDYIVDKERSFEQGVHRYIYVGTFMRRKYPSCLIPAIYKNHQDRDFFITYVGDGYGIKKIKQTVKKYHVEDNVDFTGRIDRFAINEKLDEAEVFVMISENETFGLVWLEAMARGCITIASRNEGMDGIIEDGVNGYLCKAGDAEELASVIAKIKKMDVLSLRIMSKKAIETAKCMTDKKMAEKYIREIS